MEAFIGSNYSLFKPQVDREVGHLKCEGACTSCPHPEIDKYPEVEDQVEACWNAVSVQYLASVEPL